MRWRSLALAVTLTTLHIGPRPEAAPPADDKARIQGVWTMAENVINGYAATDRQIRTWLLVVEDDLYNPGSGETSVEYRFELDPTLTPKAIDLVSLQGEDRGRHYRGIYSIEGDVFTVCRPLDPDDDRPAGFTARAGSNMTRVVWKRRKSSDRPGG
jgi:uncharacterized protein (TIGR03067 family)